MKLTAKVVVVVVGNVGTAVIIVSVVALVVVGTVVVGIVIVDTISLNVVVSIASEGVVDVKFSVLTDSSSQVSSHFIVEVVVCRVVSLKSSWSLSVDVC